MLARDKTARYPETIRLVHAPSQPSRLHSILKGLQVQVRKVQVRAEASPSRKGRTAYERNNDGLGRQASE